MRGPNPRATPLTAPLASCVSVCLQNVAMQMREYQALNVKYLPSEEEKRLKVERLEAARLAEIAAKEKAEFDAFVEEKQAAGRAARERKARGAKGGGDDPGSGDGAD